MATVAVQSGAGLSFLRAFAKPFSAINSFFIALAEAGSRMQRIEALNAMSDEDLAAKGLSREDIVRHVFADKMGF